MSWSKRIYHKLERHRTTSFWRYRPCVEHNNAREIMLNGNYYLNFSSNDYLGLSQNSSVIEAWKQGAENAGVGAKSSGYISGYSSYHAQLEEQLAHWLGYPRALLFISGFTANQAVIHLLTKKHDLIVADKLTHASLLDAAIHSPAKLRRFIHNQVDSLAKLLKISYGGNTLVVTEGIFSMEGDSAPLSAIIQETQCVDNAWLIVDDAHGIGVIGKYGRGSCWTQKVQPELLIITFSKSFGVSGAALLCNEMVADYIEQFSRHLIYTTAMPPAQCCAIMAALEQVQQGDELREKLQSNIMRFRTGADNLPWKLKLSDSAIQPLIIGENQIALRLSQQLAEMGCWVHPIFPPTIPSGTARLRITLTAAHNYNDIDFLLEKLYAAGQ